MADLYSIVLAQGNLPAGSGSEASLYSPASGKHGTNLSLTLRNKGGSTRVVTIRITQSGGSPVEIDQVTLYSNWTRDIEGIHLGPADDLRGYQDSGTDVTFNIMGGTDA